jgi:predicted glycoside hydrolase/deacetylase ChbG (UPF0249 family)
MDKLLIINADDFGLDEEVNLAIIEAHRNGLVRSASLMVNMPGTESAARMARREPSLKVGLHLNISEGLCAAPRRSLGLLVDDEGRFRFDTAEIANSLQRWRCWIDEKPEFIVQFATEIRYQVETFRNLGLSLAHLNAHHYLPLIHSRLYSSYVRLAESLGVPFRGLCEPMLELLRTPTRGLAEIASATRSARVPSPFVSISNLLDATHQRDVSSSQYRSLIEAKLTELASREEVVSVEIIVHPAIPRERPGDVYAWARQLETMLVHSAEFRRRIESLRYSIGDHSSLSTRL